MTLPMTKNHTPLLIPSLMMVAIALFVFPVTGAETPTTSIFFTPEETQTIQTLESQDKTNAPNNAQINLGAIMYYGEGDWAVWLQGERWTPTTHHDDLRIISVTANEVKLSYTPTAGAVAQEVTLHPHQTYQIGTGKIVEGVAE
jgi:hypothetical protein